MKKSAITANQPDPAGQQPQVTGQAADRRYHKGDNLSLTSSTPVYSNHAASLPSTLRGRWLAFRQPTCPPHKRHFAFCVMSYHSSWSWPKDQLRGFKTALAGLDVEYEVVELDTKRNSDDASIPQQRRNRLSALSRSGNPIFCMPTTTMRKVRE